MLIINKLKETLNTDLKILEAIWRKGISVEEFQLEKKFLDFSDVIV